MLISPFRLNRGDKVAIVAPSSPFQANELAEGLDVIISQGLIPVLGKNVSTLNVHGIHSAPIKDRVDELMWAFSNPDIRGIICALGGFGCAEILPFLDYSVIRKSKKVFISMSDGTALNNGLLAGAGLINFNAQTPSIRLDKGRDIYNSDVDSLVHVLKLCMLRGQWGDLPFKISDYFPRTIVPGFAKGTSIGGNLDTLCTLIGSNYFPNVENPILFIEDVHKGSVAIARLLLHLKLSGLFEKLSGIVIGEFADVPEKKDINDPSIEDVLLEYFADLTIPVLYGFSFSHGPHTCPIPIGAKVLLDASERKVSFDFSLTI